MLPLEHLLEFFSVPILLVLVQYLFMGQLRAVILDPIVKIQLRLHWSLSCQLTLQGEEIVTLLLLQLLLQLRTLMSLPLSFHDVQGLLDLLIESDLSNLNRIVFVPIPCFRELQSFLRLAQALH